LDRFFSTWPKGLLNIILFFAKKFKSYFKKVGFRVSIKADLAELLGWKILKNSFTMLMKIADSNIAIAGWQYNILTI
jgi:hypothetical protein